MWARSIHWVFLAAVFVAACTAFDPLDQTGPTINRSATDYANDAILLNIVRASLSEPLTFVTITGLDGTQSATGSLGLPSITFGWHAATAPRTYTFGPNSVGRTNSNTFHVSVVDDPASFTALLAPLNPAVLAFFIQQGYPRELLFFLFTERLRKVETDETGKVTKVDQEWANNPSDNTVGGKFQTFLNKMVNLLLKGLTAETDATTVPTGRTFPPTKLCIDPKIERPNFAISIGDKTKKKLEQEADSCESSDWIQTQGGGSTGAAGGTSPSGGAGGAGETSMMAVGPDHSLWVAVGGENEIVRITPGADGTLAISKPIPLPKPSKPKPKYGPLIAYPLEDISVDPSGTKTVEHYQLFMRSTYGVYDYVGALLHKNTDIDNLLQKDESGYGGMVNVIPPRDVTSQKATESCFADVDYRGTHYCVPDKADRTKRLFSLLHQLQELNTAPSNAPTTLTVTTVP